jgi:hypothetical protein
MSAGSKPAVSVERAADFIWRNARLLERALFARVFRQGAADAVVAALLAYRNPDGGFGHALEPDVRAPASMPLHCDMALRVMDDAGIRNSVVAARLCGYLAQVGEPSGRVPIVLPEVCDYPRASHWDQPVFNGDSPNPTASLAGLLHAQGAEHPWLTRATEWCWRRLESPLGDAHEIASALVFLEHAPDRARAQKLAAKLVRQADGASYYHRAPGATTYGLTPLHLCPRPDSIARSAFPDDLIDAHLDDLASRQQDDGGWPIYFQPPSVAATFEWRGRWTLEALITLRAYGRI